MKMLRVFLAALLVALPLTAQQQPITTITHNTLQDTSIASFDANGTKIFNVQNGATRHQVTFRSQGTITAPTTMTISCKADTNNNFAQVGTSALLNDTITWYGTVSACEAVVTSFTGSGSIDAWYYGDSVTSQAVGITGAPFNTPIGAVGDALKVSVTPAQPVTVDGFPIVTVTPTVSGFDTDYAGTGATVFTLSATSGTVITANTLMVLQLSCYNITAGAITINRTDTAGNQFEVAYSIPANSNYERNYSWGEKMVGVKMWASAISSINCTLTARQ